MKGEKEMSEKEMRPLKMLRPPAAYRDCNGLSALGECRILTEPFCVTRGKCKFYKPKEGAAENEKTES